MVRRPGYSPSRSTTSWPNHRSPELPHLSPKARGEGGGGRREGGGGVDLNGVSFASLAAPIAILDICSFDVIWNHGCCDNEVVSGVFNFFRKALQRFGFVTCKRRSATLGT